MFLECFFLLRKENIRSNALLFFLPLLSAFIFSCSSNAETNTNKQKAASSPNILWLVAEDLGSYLPSFGDSTIATPHLSKLAEEGVRYTHVFSPAGVCAPSRAAIATGMYPTSIGANHMRTHSYTEVTGLPKYEAIPPPEVRMLSEQLRMAGYYCTNNAKNDYQFKAPVTAWDENGREAHWRNRPDLKQPFYSVFNFGVTHESGLFEPYEREELIPKNIDFPIPPYLPDNEIAQRDLWKVYNNIALLDREIGKILAQLKEDGLMDKTVIFFYTDHGGPLPRQKRLLYDAGLRVPMIIRFPDGLDAGTVSDQLISFVDLVPTTLEIARQPLPAYLQGRSFLGATPPRAYIHAASDRFDGFTDAIRAVRDDRFKYIRNYRPEQGYYLPITFREQIPSMQSLLALNATQGLDEIQSQWFRENKPAEELFDCLHDPHEINNLANDTTYFKHLAELRAEMDRWLLATGDQPNVPERQLIDKLWKGSNDKPRTSNPKIVVLKDGSLEVTCSTSGASIGYQLVRNEHPNSWKIYQTPFPIDIEAEIAVIAHRLGYTPSDTIWFTGTSVN